VNLKIGEQLSTAHTALNEQSFVPVLELENGTTLTQSLAIIDYLEMVYPAPSLLPSNPVLQAKIRAAAQIISADIAPIQNLKVLKYIRAEHGQDDKGVRKWAAHWIAEGFRALETIVQMQDAPFLINKNPGYFECCLIPQIYNAYRFGVDMSEFPHLLSIQKATQNRPAFIEAAPENQIDAPKLVK